MPEIEPLLGILMIVISVLAALAAMLSKSQAQERFDMQERIRQQQEELTRRFVEINVNIRNRDEVADALGFELNELSGKRKNDDEKPKRGKRKIGDDGELIDPDEGYGEGEELPTHYDASHQFARREREDRPLKFIIR